MSLHSDIHDRGRREFLAAGAAGTLLALGGGIASAAPTPNERRAAASAGAAAGLADILYTGAFDGEKYVLPPLPYDYAALEPHIDAETMKLHHDKHHLGYVNGANDMMGKLADMRQGGTFDAIEAVEQKLAFHGAGHFLHCIFWQNMAPKGEGGEMSRALDSAVGRDLSSADGLKAQFVAAAKAVEGSGWALLTYNVADGRLNILQARNHQHATQWANIPLLVVDVWEHAYYKKYGPDRAGYVDNFMQVVNWADVSRRYEAAAAAFGRATR